MVSDIESRRRSRFAVPLALVGLLAMLWFGFLLWMTLTVSNPVTLNQFQVLNSDFIVQGTFPDNSRGLAVEKCWPEGGLDGLIRFENRSELQPESETHYLIPVVRLEGKLYATPSRVKGIPLIYPVNDESLRQLQELLAKKAGQSPRQSAPHG